MDRDLHPGADEIGADLVIVLARYTRKTDVFAPTPMVIPRLSARQHELDRLMVECEAMASLQLGRGLRLALTLHSESGSVITVRLWRSFNCRSCD